jgi:cytochrome oxidase assembly protein ShyY1
MSKLRLLLRPGWIVLAIVVAAFAYLCFTVLAPWQLGKNTDTERRNDLIARSLDAPREPFAAVLPADQLSAEDEWRRVEAAGEYVPELETLVRLRAIEGAPSYEVLTPLRLDDGRLVIVNRGYVLPVNGTEAPPVAAPPTGRVVLHARLRAPEGSSGRPPLTDMSPPQLYSIDPPEIGALTGERYVDAYLQLEEGQPGGLGVIPLPHLDAGPFLSYGLQWIAFGIMAPLGLAYFVRAELRERRKKTEPAAGSSTAAQASGAPANSGPSSDPVGAKLADRYGKRR